MVKQRTNDIISLCFVLMNIAGFVILSAIERPVSVTYILLDIFAIFAVWVVLRRVPFSYFLTCNIFVLISMFFGSCAHFYILFSWYDLFLHFTSGIVLAAVANYFWLKRESKVGKENDFIMQLFFCFIFSVAGAGLWEIWEFCSDTFFGFNSQIGSLTDTMTDIIAGTIGAGVFVLVYFLKQKAPFAIRSKTKKMEHSVK